MAVTLDADTLWCADNNNLIVTRFAEVSFVFVRLSGETHMLNFLSQAILDLLVEQSLDIKQIISDIPQRVGLIESECPPAIILKTFHELEATGMIGEVTGQDNGN